jgi:hypothetical protein
MQRICFLCLQALLIYSGITMLFGSIVGVSYRDN